MSGLIGPTVILHTPEVSLVNGWLTVKNSPLNDTFCAVREKYLNVTVLSAFTCGDVIEGALCATLAIAVNNKADKIYGVRFISKMLVI